MMSQKESLISILMPVFNTAAFLPACLESILNQTESNWELIAVDDHSTDDSLEILRAYAQRDTRIQVFGHLGKGIIPALRKAFSQSVGAYITRMDSDDIMNINKLQILKNIILNHPVGTIATGKVAYFSDTMVQNGYIRYQNWLNEWMETGQSWQQIYKECVLPSPCWLLRRADLVACGGFEPDTYPEDYDLCFRFYEQKYTIAAHTDFPIHYWRDSATRTSRNDPNYASNQYFNLKINYFLKLNFDINRPLVLWGGGDKGKTLIRAFKNHVPPHLLHWVTNNLRKVGQIIENQKLTHYENILHLKHPQIITAVAQPSGQLEIEAFLQKNGFKMGADYFPFC
jgi:glycosyltransferase involved in cell wall biosynthesis